jgi:hypothetical protein
MLYICVCISTILPLYPTILLDYYSLLIVMINAVLQAFSRREVRRALEEISIALNHILSVDGVVNRPRSELEGGPGGGPGAGGGGESDGDGDDSIPGKRKSRYYRSMSTAIDALATARLPLAELMNKTTCLFARLELKVRRRPGRAGQDRAGQDRAGQGKERLGVRRWVADIGLMTLTALPLSILSYPILSYPTDCYMFFYMFFYATQQLVNDRNYYIIDETTRRPSSFRQHWFKYMLMGLGVCVEIYSI